MVLLNGDDANCVEVAQKSLAPIVEVGFSENCAQRIRDVLVFSRKVRNSRWKQTFAVPLIGEFNVRNAAMAISAADSTRARGEDRTRWRIFRGARRQEIRGEVHGVKVIDDFGHHPTAIAKTLTALRHRYTEQRIWAMFEPRSNTTRRAVFQRELPDALKTGRRGFPLRSGEAGSNSLRWRNDFVQSCH